MNLQELQFIKREKLPITVVVFNNSSLGMIRAWQSRYLGRVSHTTVDSGYETPDFSKIAEAFDLTYIRVAKEDDLEQWKTGAGSPALIELVPDSDMDTCPLRNYQDQQPLLERELLQEIMTL